MKNCPCHSGKRYSQCCEPYHLGQAAPTAEALMRSRYTAYALKLADYLNATWHPDTLKNTITVDSLEGIAWLGLTIHDAKTIDNTHATVKFTVLFDQGEQQPMQMTENSLFVLENDRWLYVDGTHT